MTKRQSKYLLYLPFTICVPIYKYFADDDLFSLPSNTGKDKRLGFEYKTIQQCWQWNWKCNEF